MMRVAKLDELVKSTEWKALVDGFLFDCKVRNLTEKTIEGYAQRLTYLIRWCMSEHLSVEDVTHSHLQGYLASIIGKLSDATVNGRIRVLKLFFGFLDRDGFLSNGNPAEKIRLIRQDKRIKPVVTANQMGTLLRDIDKKSFVGLRNYSIMLVFWDGMLRKEELIQLTVDDFDIQTGLMKVHGKGRKDRWIPLGARTLRTINSYLHRFRRKVPGDRLFCLSNGKPISEWHCYRIVRRLGERVDLQLYPHLIRHSAATHFITNGGSLAVLQKILGHTSPLVTENYLHLDGEHLRKTYETMSPADSLRV